MTFELSKKQRSRYSAWFEWHRDKAHNGKFPYPGASVGLKST